MSYIGIYNKVAELEKKIALVENTNSPLSNSTALPNDLLEKINKLEVNLQSAIDAATSAAATASAAGASASAAAEAAGTANAANAANAAGDTGAAVSSDILDGIVNRINNLEDRLNELNIQDVYNRLVNLENRFIPPDLSDRVLAIESKQAIPVNNDNLLERVNNLELRYIPPDLSERVLNIETDKYITQLPLLFENVDILNNKISQS